MTARFTSFRPDVLEFHFWLVFHSDGSMRLTRAEPSLDRHERGMAMTATLPRSLWRTPALHGAIRMAEGEAPDRIDIDIEAAADALRDALGVDIDLVMKQVEP